MSDTLPEFARVLESLRLDDEALRRSTLETFVPWPTVTQANAADSLPNLVVATTPQGTPELQFTRLLGEGGHGQVQLARQQSLKRSVAVKSLKGVASEAATQALLREARITGSLEHPNVVPVYALGRGGAGEVLMVMKHVQGVPWGEVLRNEGPARTTVAIEHHTGVFFQVCNAVEAAHSRGVVHRDLKPDNIMLGAFGEVVVLDWGIAVSLAGEPERGLLPAAQVQGLAGTPAYMAPELVEGDGSKLGKWTDVYLLGAILHQIFTGRPPHQGTTVAEVLERAFHSEPQEYGPDVPEEIADICRRAMRAYPHDRYRSVKELSEAVRGFVRHRQSAQLASEAMRKLDFSGGAGSDSSVLASVAQSRFGFEQALKTWPENPVARAGLQRALQLEVRQELAQRNLVGARRALNELQQPSQELRAALEALEQTLAQEREAAERLQRMAHESNPDVTSAARNVMFLLIGVVWGIGPVAAGFAQRAGLIAFDSAFLFKAVFVWLAFAAVTTWWLRGGLFRNRIGRVLYWGGGMAVVGAFMVRAWAFLLDVPAASALTFELTIYCVIAGMGSLLDRRFRIATVAYGVGALVCALDNAHALFIVGCSNAAAMIPTAMLWNRWSAAAERDRVARTTSAP